MAHAADGGAGFFGKIVIDPVSEIADAPGVEHNLAGLFQRYVGSGRTAYIDLTAGGVDGPPNVVGYDELDERCGRVAAGLAARGLGHGARVAVAADNSVDYAALYLGVPRQGRVLVPLNTKQPRDVLAFICEDAGVQLVCCDAANADRCRGACRPSRSAPATVARVVGPRPAPRRAGGPARRRRADVHLGLDRPAQGRAAVPPQPDLHRRPVRRWWLHDGPRGAGARLGADVPQERRGADQGVRWPSAADRAARPLHRCPTSSHRRHGSPRSPACPRCSP